jgi:L-alanine-DL-glutamate epimerase-like enolase superfamily enzyme
VSELRVSAFDVPTTTSESDGTLTWARTVLVTVQLTTRGKSGFGYTYADVATAHFIAEHLTEIALTCDPMATGATFASMERAVRNVGRDGVAATAIAAVDGALWDLKAKLLDQPLVALLGKRRDVIAAYGSGGFTSYTIDELRRQLAGWKEGGLSRVKMKIGDDEATLRRIEAARDAVGDDVELFVDANGAYDRRGALALAEKLPRFGVSWFEEPVTSDDLDGLRAVRDHAASTTRVAAGEYGYHRRYFDRMLTAGAVDVLQADATRCGVTGFMEVAALCDARGVPLSAHCAPTIHCHLGCAAPRMAHVEYFYDHTRIETMLFDGASTAVNGVLRPDLSRPGIGVELKRADGRRYEVFDASMATNGAP